MDWNQKIMAMQNEAADFAERVKAAEAKISSIKAERQKLSHAEDAAEAELVALSRTVAGFQAQAVETLKALYDEAAKSAAEAAKSAAEAAQAKGAVAAAVAAAKIIAPPPPPVVQTPVAPPPPPAPAKVIDVVSIPVTPVKTPEPPKPAPAPAPVAPPPPAPAPVVLPSTTDEDDAFDIFDLK